MDDTSRNLGPVADPAAGSGGHYWSMEHYGFADDHLPAPGAIPVPAPPSPPRSRPAAPPAHRTGRRARLVGSVVLALSVLTGAGAFAAAQATAGDGGGAGGGAGVTSVVDVAPQGIDQAGDLDGRGGGDGRGGRDGGRR